MTEERKDELHNLLIAALWEAKDELLEEDLEKLWENTKRRYPEKETDDTL